MAAARLARRPGEQRRRDLARAVGRPPSVLLGRVPSERHEHYDAEGNLTGFTVVVREAEWTDTDVRQLLELADVEAGSCKGCGWHESLTGDAENVFEPSSRACPVCAGREQYDRVLADGDDKWRKTHESAKPMDPRPSDGRRPTQMTLLSPEEVQERRGGASGDQG